MNMHMLMIILGNEEALAVLVMALNATDRIGFMRNDTTNTYECGIDIPNAKIGHHEHEFIPITTSFHCTTEPSSYGHNLTVSRDCAMTVRKATASSIGTDLIPMFSLLASCSLIWFGLPEAAPSPGDK